MSTVELDAPNFTDGRGLYPERLKAYVPRGLNDSVRRAAAVEGVSRGEFIRRAVASRIIAQTDKTAALETLRAKAASRLDMAMGERVYARALQTIERWSASSPTENENSNGK